MPLVPGPLLGPATWRPVAEVLDAETTPSAWPLPLAFRGELGHITM